MAGYRSLGDFLAYVWFVLSATPGDDNDLASRSRVAVRATLAWHQADQRTRERLERAAVRAGERYGDFDPARRQRLARAGTTLSSAARLERLAARLAELFIDLEGERNAPIAVIDILDEHGLLRELLELPEHVPTSFRNRRAGQGITYFEVDIAAVLRSWLRGEEIHAMAQTYLSAVPDVSFRMEQLADFLTGTFENYLHGHLGPCSRGPMRTLSSTIRRGCASVQICRRLSATAFSLSTLCGSCDRV